MAALDVLAALDVPRAKSEAGRTGRTTIRTDADKFSTAHAGLKEQARELLKNHKYERWWNAGAQVSHDQRNESWRPIDSLFAAPLNTMIVIK